MLARPALATATLRPTSRWPVRGTKPSALGLMEHESMVVYSGIAGRIFVQCALFLAQGLLG